MQDGGQGSGGDEGGAPGVLLRAAFLQAQTRAVRAAVTQLTERRDQMVATNAKLVTAAEAAATATDGTAGLGPPGALSAEELAGLKDSAGMVSARCDKRRGLFSP